MQARDNLKLQSRFSHKAVDLGGVAAVSLVFPVDVLR